MEIHKLDDFGRSLSSKEVADLLGVSVTTVYSVAEEFGGVRVGKKYVFFEKVFFERLRAKVLRDSVVESAVLPGYVVTRSIKDVVLEGA